MSLSVRRVLTAAVAAIAAVMALAAVVNPAAAATDHGSTLTAGQQLNAGDYLSNGSYRLTMQSSGNLVLDKGSTPLFASNTYMSGDHNFARFQSDGNFVLYDAGGNAALWSTNTYKMGATKVTLQADGNLVLYDGSNAVWATGTENGYNELENSKIFSIARTMIGKYPYVFGGGHSSQGAGPTKGAGSTLDFSDGGNMDCSGFVRWVYYKASGKDIMNGDTSTQLNLANRNDGHAAPGELIFYRDSSGIHHVGIYGGNGKLINEYDTGYKVIENGVSDSTGAQLKYYWRSW